MKESWLDKLLTEFEKVFPVDPEAEKAVSATMSEYHKQKQRKGILLKDKEKK